SSAETILLAQCSTQWRSKLGKIGISVERKVALMKPRPSICDNIFTKRIIWAFPSSHVTIGVRQSMATAPTASHNLDDSVATRVKKNLKNGLAPVPYAQPDSRKKHNGGHANPISWDIPPPKDLSFPLAPYPQQNNYISGMNRQEPPLGLWTSTWPNHSAGLSCPPGVNDLLSRNFISSLHIITSYRSIPYLGQPSFSTQGSTYHPPPFPPNRTNNMPASNILESPLAYANNGTPSAPSGSPPDYTNSIYASTSSAPVFISKKMHRYSLDIDHYRIDGIGMWPPVPPQSTPVAAETTDPVYKEKRDVSEAESGTKVGPNKKGDYSGVCESGFPSGAVCLVVLTAFFVALVLLVLGISFAYRLRPVDIQRLHPLLLGLLD
ncbi:15438_t:CDS:2, partial [Acaulospora colombiana]